MKIIQIDSGSQCAISCDVSFADSLVACRKPTPHTNDGVLRVSYQQGQKIKHNVSRFFYAPYWFKEKEGTLLTTRARPRAD